jgi:hypothetical protein
VLEQVQGLFNEILYKQCAAVQEAAGPYVRRVSEGFAFPRPLIDLVWRSSLRKDYEIFGTILDLVKAQKSGIALPLLRPMIEDMLYLEYLAALPPPTANKIIYLGSFREILQSALAQANGDGNAAWADIGWPRSRSVGDDLKKIEEDLAKVGETLGWRRGSHWPSTAHVANKTGSTAIYEHIYQGSSRGVHFSPHHLLRMIWGNAGGAHTANLDNFERYYKVYALTNAGWIFCNLLSHCWTVADQAPDEELKRQVDELTHSLSKFGAVPLVTAEELMTGARVSAVEDSPNPPNDLSEDDVKQ